MSSDFGDIDDDDLILAASQTETLISSQRTPLKVLPSNQTSAFPPSQIEGTPAPKLLTTSPSSDFGDIDDDDLIFAASQTDTLISSQRSPLEELSSNRSWTPPSSQSQPTPALKLLSKAPSSSQQPPISSQPQSQPVVRPQDLGPYRFTFGKHKGKKVDEVPKGYISFLREQGILERIPRPNSALEEMDRHEEQRRLAAQASAALIVSQMAARIGVAQPPPLAPQAPPPSFRFPFGMHKNKTLSEVPDGYIQYVKAQGLADEVPGLAAALELFENPPATLPSSLSAVVPMSSAPSSSAPAKSCPPSSSQRPALAPMLMATPPSSSLPQSSMSPWTSQIQGSVPTLSALPPVSSLPPSSVPPSSSQIPQIALPDALTYRFTFGVHVGRSLAEVPFDYLSHLNDRGIISSRPDLAAAIADLQQQNPSLFAPPDPSLYVLNFGSNHGMTLDSVPPSYIQYLKNEKISDTRPDLAAALKYFDRKNKKAQKERARKGKSSSRPTKPFDVPGDRTHDVGRFFRNDKQMWITAGDAKAYFGVETQAVLAAGVHAISGGRSKKGTRFWLHQVFYFAKHFKTTGSDTPTQALNKFKARNYEVGGGSITKTIRWGGFR
ncbi:hypothetical protein BU16DRAFT_535453 [Lophium mytilinum]|uniref:Uncharacterized protein n=1 Tax=Lophium mytilinum TaxID=390894 RepID=A0A6A6R3G3_9PEZI|nr:hypothetical protein BU16DRAFT_535453 [Lophium mytilinum]